VRGRPNQHVIMKSVFNEERFLLTGAARDCVAPSERPVRRAAKRKTLFISCWRFDPEGMSDGDHPAQPFFLIVTDHDRGVFAVEGPMTGPGRKPRHMPGTISTASCVARPAPIATSWPRIAVRTGWPVCRREAS
jgi:hypothetical protein